MSLYLTASIGWIQTCNYDLLGVNNAYLDNHKIRGGRAPPHISKLPIPCVENTDLICER